jgi:hypothetical protein
MIGITIVNVATVLLIFAVFRWDHKWREKALTAFCESNDQFLARFSAETDRNLESNKELTLLLQKNNQTSSVGATVAALTKDSN